MKVRHQEERTKSNVIRKEPIKEVAKTEMKLMDSEEDTMIISLMKRWGAKRWRAIGNIGHLFLNDLNLYVNQKVVSGNSQLDGSINAHNSISDDMMGSDRFCTVQNQCHIMEIIYLWKIYVHKIIAVRTSLLRGNCT